MKHSFKHKLLATAMLLAASAGAQAQIYKATLSGANEVPAVTTSGTGIGVVSLNTKTDQLRVMTTFSGLNGNVTASHVHCCTAPGANAGVATMTPTFSNFPTGVTAGSYDATFNTTQAATWNAAFITANGGTPEGAETALANGLNAGQAYLNIHTTTSPGGEIRANLQRFSFVPASSGRTAGVAYALDALGSGTGSQNQALLNLALLGNAQQGTALAALMPMPTTVVGATLINGLYSDYDSLSNRLGALRGDEGAHGLWFRYADRQNDYDLSDRLADAESDGEDISAGLDHRLDSGLLLGITVTMADDSIDYSGAMAGASGELDGWRTTFYAEQRFGAAFVEGMFTLAHSDVTHIRNLGGANGLAAAEDDSDQYGMRFAVGANVGGETLGFTPQLRVDYSNLDLGGYQESNPNGLGLSVIGQEFESLRVSLGGQMDWNMDGGISPFVRAFWVAETEHGDSVTRASFGGGPLFESRDEGPASGSYTAGLGLNFAATETFGASISYDLVDADEFESEVVQARVLFRY